MSLLKLSAEIYSGVFAVFAIAWLLCLPILIKEWRETRKLWNIDQTKKDFFKDIYKG